MKIILAFLILIPSLVSAAPDSSCAVIASGKVGYTRERVYEDRFTRHVVEWFRIEALERDVAEEALKCLVISMTVPPRGVSTLNEESIEKQTVPWVGKREKTIIRAIFRRPMP